MELLALVIINLLFAVVLYYAVSIKVTNSVKEYQSQKFKAEMNKDILSFYKESESYLAQMDSRIIILRNLIQKAESLNLHTVEISKPKESTIEKSEVKKSVLAISEHERQDENDFEENIHALGANREYLKNEYIKKTVPDSKATKTDTFTLQEKKNEDPILVDFITGLGKGVKSFLGIKDPAQIDDYEEKHFSRPQKNSNSLDYSVGGDPFEEKPSSEIKDNVKETNLFAKTLYHIQNPDESFYFNKKDEVKISPATALADLPPNSSRIEKVVHLLKKNYPHSEIASELGIAIPEVSLIETIKLDRKG